MSGLPWFELDVDMPGDPKCRALAARLKDLQAVRVGGRLDEAVLAWCREHVGAEFVLGTMTGEVCSRVAAAPDSPRRRLAALVKAGLVQARCVNKSRSLWRVDGVSP